MGLQGQTPLILAAWKGDIASVKLLLEYHAVIDARDSSGSTALVWATVMKHDEVIRILNEAGAAE